MELNIQKSQSHLFLTMRRGGGVLDLDKLEDKNFKTVRWGWVVSLEKLTPIPNYQGREEAGASLELKYFRVSKVRRGGREVNLVWTNTKLSWQSRLKQWPASLPSATTYMWCTQAAWTQNNIGIAQYNLAPF